MVMEVVTQDLGRHDKTNRHEAMDPQTTSRFWRFAPRRAEVPFQRFPE